MRSGTVRSTSGSFERYVNTESGKNYRVTYHREYESTSRIRERRLVMPCSRRRLRKIPRLLEIPISVCYHDLLAYLSSSNCGLQDVDGSRSGYSRSPDQSQKNQVRREGSARGSPIHDSGDKRTRDRFLKRRKNKRKREREREKGEWERKMEGIAQNPGIPDLRVSKFSWRSGGPAIFVGQVRHDRLVKRALSGDRRERGSEVKPAVPAKQRRMY